MKNTILLLALVLMTSTAFAQAKPANYEQPTSPEEAREGIKDACAEDFKKFCPNIKDPTQMEACMKRNAPKYSQKCSEYLVKIKMITKKPAK